MNEKGTLPRKVHDPLVSLSASPIQEALQDFLLSRRAGIRITPHMLRRTFALMALRQGMDLISLQRPVGHADLNMTSRYVALLDEDLAAAHNKHGLDT